MNLSDKWKKELEKESLSKKVTASPLLSNKSGVSSDSILFWHKPENNKIATIDHPQQQKGPATRQDFYLIFVCLFCEKGIPISIVVNREGGIEQK